MGDFRELEIKKLYSSRRGNTVSDFYEPTLKRCRRYDRTSGYFSPSVLALAASGFANFANNGSKMRLLTGIELSRETLDAIKNSGDYGRIDGILMSKITPEELEENNLESFAKMLATGVIEMRVALLPDNDEGILHKKVGLMEDDWGNKIYFCGSNNETYNGWARNIEEFAVFCNWWSYEDECIINDQRRDFDDLWEGREEHTIVCPVSEAVKWHIIREVNSSNSYSRADLKSIKDSDLEPRPYQVEAITAWRKNNYRGIMEMATGTGKTLTSLFAAREYFDDDIDGLLVVVVPFKHLIEQWEKDVWKIFQNSRLIRVSSDFPSWKQELPLAVRAYERGETTTKTIVLTTYKSFSSQLFYDTFKNLKRKNVLIADEIHNARSKDYIDCFKLFDARLGLSATPRNDFVENEAGGNIDLMIEEMGGIIYEYPLDLAIKNGVLVGYEYYPWFVFLSDEEAEEYKRISEKIASFLASDADNDIGGLLAKRGAVVKNASEKKDAFPRILDKIIDNKANQFLLVYCDSAAQISEAQEILTHKDIVSSKITYNEDIKERAERLAAFEEGNIDCLVARKCLDEGVNIPPTRTAIIMASNTDNREYIQRLGRILRNYTDVCGNKKEKAVVYDLVICAPDESERYSWIKKTELRRMKFFAENALNKEYSERQIDLYEQGNKGGI